MFPLQNRTESLILALKGALWILFGLACISLANGSLENIAYLFGGAAVLSGIASFVFLYVAKPQGGRAQYFRYEAFASLLLGALVLLFPTFVIQLFMTTLGCIAILAGMVQCVLAFDFKRYAIAEWLLLASGFLTALLGLILIKNPTAIVSFVTWLIGIAFGAAGAYLIWYSLPKKTAQVSFPEPNPSVEQGSLT